LLVTCTACAGLIAELERRVSVLDEDIRRNAFYCDKDKLKRERSMYAEIIGLLGDSCP